MGLYILGSVTMLIGVFVGYAIGAPSSTKTQETFARWTQPMDEYESGTIKDASITTEEL